MARTIECGGNHSRELLGECGCDCGDCPFSSIVGEIIDEVNQTVTSPKEVKRRVEIHPIVQ